MTIPAFVASHTGVHHFFGTRHGHRTSAFEDVAVVSVRQIHGTDILVVDRPVRPGEQFAGQWDALVTNQPKVMLTIRTADCVPVLIHDPDRKVVGAIHAGWRGAVARILPRTIEFLHRRFGSDPASLRIGIGPSAGPCCYEVDEPVLTPLRTSYPHWRQVARETGVNKALLDLRGLIRGQSEAEGVPAAQVHVISLCTICNPELFYSYRREGVVNATMVSGIMLLP